MHTRLHKKKTTQRKRRLVSLVGSAWFLGVKSREKAGFE